MALIGLKNLYYAIMESDAATAAAYQTPVKLGHAVSVDVNPTVNRNYLYGDDMPVEANTSVDETTVKIETTDISLKDQAALLGHTYIQASDTMIVKSSDSAPYVALLFESERHDGSTKCVKLYKGKFAPSQETINTRGANLEYQVPSMEGVFIARADGKTQEVKIFPKDVTTENWYASV